MRLGLTSLAVKLQRLTAWDDGQDLVEYALVVGLISIAGVIASAKIAAAIVTLYSNINASISSAIA
jgi:Flp pilus assembly pilin Flp